MKYWKFDISLTFCSELSGLDMDPNEKQIHSGDNGDIKGQA